MWQTTSISIGYYILWVWNFSVIKYPTNLCFLVNCPYVLFLKCLLNDKGMKDLASETSFTSRINLKLRSGFVRHESYRHFFTNLNEIGEGATFDETLIWWIRWKDYLNHLPIWENRDDHEIYLLFNESILSSINILTTRRGEGKSLYRSQKDLKTTKRRGSRPRVLLDF